MSVVLELDAVFQLFCSQFFGDDPSVVLADPAYCPTKRHMICCRLFTSHVWGLLAGHGAFPNLFFKSGSVTSMDCLSVKLAYSRLRSSEVPRRW